MSQPQQPPRPFTSLRGLGDSMIDWNSFWDLDEHSENSPQHKDACSRLRVALETEYLLGDIPASIRDNIWARALNQALEYEDVPGQVAKIIDRFYKPLAEVVILTLRDAPPNNTQRIKDLNLQRERARRDVLEMKSRLREVERAMIEIALNALRGEPGFKEPSHNITISSWNCKHGKRVANPIGMCIYDDTVDPDHGDCLFLP